MNGLSQFLVSIFHCRGEKREQGCREAEEGRIKDLTNNILIFPVILSPSLSLLSTSLLFPATSSVAGYSLSKPFLIPPSFQLSFNIYLFLFLLLFCVMHHLSPASPTTLSCLPGPPITTLERLCTNPLAQQPPSQPC